MRESQYIHDYLDGNEKYRWTPGTYLHYTLRGKAKRYQQGYLRALMRAIDRRMDVIPVRSARGSTAYVWREGAERV